MPVAEAEVPTDRASRYLVQFCRHASQMSRMRHRPLARHGSGRTAPTVEHAEWSDTIGKVRFPHGHCTMFADPDALTLRVEADDEDGLRRLQDGITRRLETIGRRDQLTLTWQRPNTTPGVPPTNVTHTKSVFPPAAGKRRRGRLSTLGWVALATLAIVAHLGLLGGALAATVWGTWGANAILAIILVKVIAVGGHLIGGRFAIRHTKAFRRHRKPRHSPPEHTPAGHAVRRD